MGFVLNGAPGSWAEPLGATPWDETPDIPPDLLEAAGGHPLVARLLARRGITTPAAVRGFLDPDRYAPRPPTDLPGVQEAVARLRSAVSQGVPIGVWGDFDVDGVTAATVLQEALLRVGARVSWTHIPHRETEGHGVHLPTLQGLVADGTGLVVTCDTGITAIDAVAWAAEAGVGVIVTDHHLPEDTLPLADAIVTPRFLPADHPLAGLPGVGVAYVLAQALLVACDQDDEPGGLDLVALGIVADVATQTGDVRYLLQRGLAALRATRRPGLLALLEIAGVNVSGLTEEHIGFTLAPRLNALGRLAHAQVAVDLFTTQDLAQARAIASQMEALNARRQLLCSQVTAGALDQLERNPGLLDAPVLIVGHPLWDPGVVGIVAARLAERFGRPAIVLSTPPDGPCRGSARSVPGVDISAAIGAHRDLLLSFGGHPMAAGLSLLPERLPDFRHALALTVEQMLAAAPLPPAVQVDAYLGWEDATLELAQELDCLAPFGAGNPPPCFVTRNLHVVSATDLGRTGEHRRVKLADENGTERTVLWWHGADSAVPDGAIDLAYTLRTRNFRGQPDVQIEWLAWRPVVPLEVTVAPVVAAMEMVDLRQATRPLETLRALAGSGQAVQVWAEVCLPEGVASVPRHSLAPSSVLAVWTVPPGAREWSAALARVRPRQVYLFAQDPGTDVLPAFLRRLAGLVKYALRARGGRVEYAELAAAMGHREEAVRLGLLWLTASGQVRVEGEDLSGMDLSAGEHAGIGPAAGLDRAGLQRRLNDLLAETAAYRRYWRTSDLTGEM